MHILLTSDDGMDAEGLWCLYDELVGIANVSVIVPKLDSSGVSHAITLRQPLRAGELFRHGEQAGWWVQGTPVDCVKLGITHLLETPVDLVVSGINHGPNVGENLFYSGTVAAAVEAQIQNTAGIAVSLDVASGRDFTSAAKWAAAFILEELGGVTGEALLLNINIPGSWANIKGIRLTTQSRSGFREEYERRQDPNGEDYFWVKGQMHVSEGNDQFDAAALTAQYISITPLHIDLTDYRHLEDLHDLEKDFHENPDPR
ncbi:5'/3'-nucleotidase SurE [Planctomycetota bacterium]